jgi:hypothetical protein
MKPGSGIISAQKNLNPATRNRGVRHKNALASIIMFAMTSTALCSRVAAPAKLNKRAERKTVARAAVTTADAASRRETLGLMAVRSRALGLIVARGLSRSSSHRVVLVGWIDRFLTSRDPSFRGITHHPKHVGRERARLDDRARVAARPVGVFPVAASHRVERISPRRVVAVGVFPVGARPAVGV